MKKVQWATYHWINGKGDERPYKPSLPTVNNEPISAKALAWPYDLAFPGELAVEKAKRLGILDVWKPVCRLHITANRTLTFVGERATRMWRAYNEYIYNKK